MALRGQPFVVSKHQPLRLHRSGQEAMVWFKKRKWLLKMEKNLHRGIPTAVDVVVPVVAVGALAVPQRPVLQPSTTVLQVLNIAQRFQAFHNSSLI